MGTDVAEQWELFARLQLHHFAGQGLPLFDRPDQPCLHAIVAGAQDGYVALIGDATNQHDVLLGSRLVGGLGARTSAGLLAHPQRIAKGAGEVWTARTL
jgi:hypothetical protein